MSYEETLKSYSSDADASVGIFTGPPGLPGSAAPNTGMQYRGLRITGAHQVGLAVASRAVTDGATHTNTVVDSATAVFTVNDVGLGITGTGIPAGAYIKDIISATSVHISVAATATASSVPLTIGAGIVVGVLQNKPQRPGAACTVGFQGISNLMAGAAVVAGLEVVPDSTGRFVNGTATGPGLRFIAHGLTSGAGQLFPAQIA